MATQSQERPPLATPQRDGQVEPVMGAEPSAAGATPQVPANGIQRIRRRLRWKHVLVAVLLTLAVVGSYVFYRWLLPEPFPEGLLQVNGRIEGDHVTVASKFPGRVLQLLARDGDSVTKGQVIIQLEDDQTKAKVNQAKEGVAVLDAQVRAGKQSLYVLREEVPLDIEASEAEVAHYKAMLAKAESTEAHTRENAERARTLFATKAISDEERDRSQLAWQVASHELASERTGLTRSERRLDQAKLGPDRIKSKEEELAALQAQAQQARAAQAEAESVLGDLTIRAPTDGVVLARMVDGGEVVAAGTPLLDLVNLDRLYLQVYVPEVEIGKVRRGLPAQVYTDAYPDQPFPSTVRYISSRAEFTPKEVQTKDERVKLIYAVRLYLDANPGHRLTPGMPADAVIRWKEDTQWAKPRW